MNGDSGAWFDYVPVYPGQYVRGWHLDGHRDREGRPQTWDPWQRPGAKGNTARVRMHGEVMRWRRACAALWPTWAMLAPYVLVRPDGEPFRTQPRVTKDVYPLLRERGMALAFGAIILEGDNPGKSDWTPDLLDAWMEQCRTSPLLRGALTWPTPHGFRIVYLIDGAPMYVPEHYEARVLALIEAHRREGLTLDDKTRDWTRLNAPPRHTRRAKEGGQEIVVGERWDAALAFEDVSRWRLSDLPDPRRYAPAVRRPGARAVVTVAATFVRLDAPPDAGDAWEPELVTFAKDAPPVWAPRVRTLAAACLAVPTEWHSLFLALAGALCERGVAEELVPAIVGAVSAATGNDSRTADRITSAVSTVGRWLAWRAGNGGQGVTGHDALVRHWPAVADALDEATDGAGPARLERLCNRPAPELPHRDEATRSIEEAIRNALRGVNVVVTGCGTGKTTCGIRVAAEGAVVAPGAERAPPGTKTAFALPTNAKADEVYRDLLALGVPARRIYSPLAHKEGDAFTCVHRDAGRHLAAGHLSVRREFCDGPRGGSPCERRAVCPAYAGAEGDQHARVLVGTHALLDELSAHAGPTGRLIVDESPPLVTVERFTAADLSRVAEFGFAFQPRFVEACAPLVTALHLGTESSRGEAQQPLAELAARWRRHLDPERVARACAAAGVAFDREGDLLGQALLAASEAAAEGRVAVPELYPVHAMRARGQDSFAACVGTAARVLVAVHRAAAAALAVDGQAPHAARVEQRGSDGARVLVLHSPNAPLVRALARDGVTILLDACPDVHALSLLCGADLDAQGRVTRHHAAAGADVARTLLYWREGSRRWLFRRDGIYPDPLRSALRATVRWALETPACTRLGIVTFARVELVLGAALARETPTAAACRAAWTAQGLDAANFDACVAAVVPVLDEFLGAPVPTGAPSRRVLLAHYGAIRGLNRLEREGVTAMATLGDPRSELDEAQHEAAYLGIDDWQARYERKAREEIEQAHGRLRVIWRQEKLVALHAGTLLPSDPLWSGGVSFRRIPAHRPRADAAMTPAALQSALDDAKLSTLRSAASRLGISKSLLSLYLRGEQAITADFAAKVAALRGTTYACPTNPNESEGYTPWGSLDNAVPLAVQLGGKTWTPSEAEDWWFDATESTPTDAE